ncbi:MAG TPA: hypothetical protein VK155_01990 [Bacteroidales bacterium]|jgi:hypothetical protein|nr:hypothetical protein [Bacteroidales bacterium]
MNEKIKSSLTNPEILEKLYHEDRKKFRNEFEKLYPEIENSEAAKFWKARLDYDSKPEILKTIALPEIIMVVAVCLLTAFLIKIPDIFRIKYPEESVFYLKNGAIIVFFGLSLYTFLNKKIYGRSRIVITALLFLVPVIYSNLLPLKNSDTITLVYIHLQLLMWFIYGIVYTGPEIKNMERRADFIRHNGDLAIVYALIAIAGGLLTALTIGLFQSIGVNIEEFYFRNIVMTGMVAVPVIADYLTEKFPALVSRTAPLIAAIFSPLVLITLLVFLVTVAVTGKDPYNDRNFLLIFNLMLLGVMAIIIFSVSETSVIKNRKFNAAILFGLSVVTIITDLIALSAIAYRLNEFGITPNRLAVLVSNLLVLINIALIMIDLFRINFRKKEFGLVSLTVSKFLPVYLSWIIIVVFGFPLIFGLN